MINAMDATEEDIIHIDGCEMMDERVRQVLEARAGRG